MKIQNLILRALQQNHDTIAITPCGAGTCIKSHNSKEVGGQIGGAEILSAGGSSCIQMFHESIMDILDSISSDEVRGLHAVGWLINVSLEGITLLANQAAGGRRHGHYDQVAIQQNKLRRVA